MFVCFFSRKLKSWDHFCQHTDRALDTMTRLVRESRGGLAREMIRYDWVHCVHFGTMARLVGGRAGEAWPER
jgi:hypothetical protein